MSPSHLPSRSCQVIAVGRRTGGAGSGCPIWLVWSGARGELSSWRLLCCLNAPRYTPPTHCSRGPRLGAPEVAGQASAYAGTRRRDHPLLVVVQTPHTGCVLADQVVAPSLTVTGHNPMTYKVGNPLTCALLSWVQWRVARLLWPLRTSQAGPRARGWSLGVRTQAKSATPLPGPG